MIRQHIFCPPFTRSQEDNFFIGDSSKPKVLVIEGNDLICRDLVSILKGASYAVFEAPNGTIGLTKAYQYLPHLILWDFHLPGTTGKELLQQIRQDPYLSQTKIVLCIENLDIEAVLPLVDACITKPYTKEQILCTVTMLVCDQPILFPYTSNDQANTDN